MASYLITGSSRGLGLALATRLLTFPPSEVGTIFATSRSESTSLKDLVEKSEGRVIFVLLDTANESSIKQAATEVEKALDGKGLDVLINNAGKMGFTPNGIASMDDLGDHFITNVQSAHLVTRAFIPLLQKGDLKKVVNISTSVGSISLASTFAPTPVPAYKISKAALNMLTVQYSFAYADQGFTIFAISPGWLKTDMGGEIADLTVEEGAKATVDRIMNAGKKDNGKFLNIYVKGWEKNTAGLNYYDGGNFPW